VAGVYRIYETGGPDVMQWEQQELPEPSGSMVLIRHRAIGLNYIDTYHRSGLYPLPMPSRLGAEAMGVVEAIGDDVSAFSPGDRVAYAGGLGAYAEANVMPQDRLVSVPDDVSDEVAAACLLKGLTACYLLSQTYPVTADDRILVHAAAGGMGLILCQWANHLGATVIGTVGTAEKAALAEANGAHHTILYRKEDTAEHVAALTNGHGVNVAYDSVGKDTFEASLNSLAPLGMFVSYGNASGNAPPVEPHDLQSRGSLFFTRPTLATYAADLANLKYMASQLFHVIAEGIVNIHINQRYALSDVVQAHRDLEARTTTGSTVIIP
jgi:NADPH2:quinone reductase|tara:strand:+ start:1091 stop:2062 length:972 start_codon:yes stop_codon:yes gene_type:complete